MKIKDCEYVKLLEYKRGNLAEQAHFGILIHMNRKEIIHRAGNDNDYKFYHRSCMKPFQASVLFDYALDEIYNLTLPEIAVCSASHSGDLIQKYNSPHAPRPL